MNNYYVKFKTNTGIVTWYVIANSPEEAKEKAKKEIIEQLETIQAYKVTETEVQGE